jgi:hypothetical protein
MARFLEKPMRCLELVMTTFIEALEFREFAKTSAESFAVLPITVRQLYAWQGSW